MDLDNHRSLSSKAKGKRKASDTDGAECEADATERNLTKRSKKNAPADRIWPEYFHEV